MQFGIVFDEILVLNLGSRARGQPGRMCLQRGLRREHDSRAACDLDGVLQRVAAEDAGTGADENHVRGAVEIVHAADPQRRLGIGMREDRATAPCFEQELEAAVPSNLGGGPRIYVS